MNDVASLAAQVRFLTSDLTKARKDSETAAREFQTKHLKNFKRSEVIRKKKEELHQQLYFVRSQLDFAATQVDTLKRLVERRTTEVQHLTATLQTEQTKCRDMEEALSYNPGSAVRLKVKALCVKYHPDHHGSRQVSNAEVVRDLVDVLSV